MMIKWTRPAYSGFTLVELMVGTVVLTGGVLILLATFAVINKNVFASKSRGLANNLAQEKIQLLQQQSYYKLLVTTNTVYDNSFSPPVGYDMGYYPPETILEGNIVFQRLTLVELVQEVSGALQVLAPTSADTGMKRVSTIITWQQGSAQKKKLETRAVVTNLDTVSANAIFTGTVRRLGAGTVIPNATINIAENAGWKDTTDSAGVYSINLSPGSYNLMATAPGYFSQLAPDSVGSNASKTHNFDLVAMASGTISGTAWINDRLVISRVVGELANAGGFLQEYVEIYNPTTWPWLVNGNLALQFQRTPGQDPSALNIDIDYISPNVNISSGGFYLFANTGTVTVGGLSVAADAVWNTTTNPGNLARFAPRFNPGNPNVITVDHDPGGAAGGIRLLVAATGNVLDEASWTGGGFSAPFSPGTALIEAAGLEEDEQYCRISSTISVLNVSQGPAYDVNNSNVELVRNKPATALPRNSFSASQAVVSGRPAAGAIVSAIDGLSLPTTAALTGSPPCALFQLTGVATGTWTVFVASGALFHEISNVTVLAGSNLGVPNAVTLPPWPASNANASLLASPNEEGFVSGQVRDVLNNPISPAVIVNAGSVNTSASTVNGSYFLRLLPGIYNVTANPGNANANYISGIRNNVSVSLGGVASAVNFNLSQGGQLRGRVTRDGVNPLPGVAVVAFDASGIAHDQEVSGTDGQFTMVNLSTGPYSVEPTVGSGERSNPPSLSATVSPASSLFVGTFTITGALGTIKGAATYQTKPIQSGVLIVASTAAIAGAPPVLSSSSLTGIPYYVATTGEDGQYRIEVRSSTMTAYRVYAYYAVLNGTTSVIYSNNATVPAVNPGQTVSGVNFSW